ncbi:putative transforming growth factor-beta receptor-associated protein 1-like [Triplophysa rosa]|uniref:Transforming growth factor-beta receptor-associated protein 1-like n=1 Tax=Triplophysa rosa TaxID=992332 RepID=A0A9W7WLY3_TRIRA|nr:putative transforming growth factor-beta receptor-associated protein 1-like [Triplophysa rosa]
MLIADYVKQILQSSKAAQNRDMKNYKKSSNLHVEKAILLEKSGKHKKALQILALALVLRFLCDSLRGTVHEKRERGLEMSLAKVESLRYKHAWMEPTREKIGVDGGCVCSHSQKRLTGPEFLRRPAGELTHISCHVGESTQ